MRMLLFLLECCFLISFGVNAQKNPSIKNHSKKDFSLQEAILFGIEQHPKKIVIDKEIERASHRKWEAIANGLPQVNSEFNYLNQIKPQLAVARASAFDNQQAIVQTVDGYFDDITRNNIPIIPLDGYQALNFNTNQQMGLTTTLTQLLFSGSYLVGIKASKAYINYNKDLKTKTLFDIEKEITDAYTAVITLDEILNITKKNINLITKSLEETRSVYKEGLIEQESVEQLQITLQQLQSQFSNSNKQMEVAKQQLNYKMGRDIEAPINTTQTLESLIQPILLQEENTSKNVIFNVNGNIDYKLVKHLETQNRIGLELEQKQKLPTVGGFLRHNLQANHDDFNFLNKNQKWYNALSFGITANIPIFSSFKSSARIKDKTLALEQSQIKVSQAKEGLLLQFKATKNKLESFIEAFQISKRSITLAKRIASKNNIKFKEGISSSLELRQAQLQWFSEQQNQLKIMAQIAKEHNTLQYLLKSS